MSSDFNFTITSWFLGNVCKKPYFNTQWGGGKANGPSVPSGPPALSNDLQRHMLAALPSNVQDEFKNLSPYVKVTNIQSIISFLTFHVIISVLHVLHAMYNLGSIFYDKKELCSDCW